MYGPVFILLQQQWLLTVLILVHGLRGLFSLLVLSWLVLAGIGLSWLGLAWLGFAVLGLVCLPCKRLSYLFIGI